MLMVSQISIDKRGGNWYN